MPSMRSSWNSEWSQYAHVDVLMHVWMYNVTREHVFARVDAFVHVRFCACTCEKLALVITTLLSPSSPPLLPSLPTDKTHTLQREKKPGARSRNWPSRILTTTNWPILNQ